MQQQPGPKHYGHSVMSVQARALDTLIDTACMCSTAVEVQGEHEKILRADIAMPRLAMLSSYLLCAGRKLAAWDCQTLARSVDADVADQAPSTTRRYEHVDLPWLSLTSTALCSASPIHSSGQVTKVMWSHQEWLIPRGVPKADPKSRRHHAVASCFDCACHCKDSARFCMLLQSICAAFLSLFTDMS